jgi:hypothetical protein
MVGRTQQITLSRPTDLMPQQLAQIPGDGLALGKNVRDSILPWLHTVEDSAEREFYRTALTKLTLNLKFVDLCV